MTDFGEVYTEYFTDVYKYVLSLSRDESVAEEVTQETFFQGDAKNWPIQRIMHVICVAMPDCEKHLFFLL